MSTHTPPPLYEQTKQSLLKNWMTSSIALQSLPTQIFKDLFMDAFMGEHHEALKEMMLAWPLPCLPLGSLLEMWKPQPDLQKFQMEERKVQALKFVLDVLDMLLTQKICPSTRKLKVLDLRDEHSIFWRVRPRAMAHASAPDYTCIFHFLEDPLVTRPPQLLNVMLDLCVRGTLDKFQTCLLEWAQPRRHLIRLCCRRMNIYGMPFNAFLDVLNMLELNCVQEVKVCRLWGVKNMASFSPFLGQMRNLQKLTISPLYKNTASFTHSSYATKA
ncbi:PRAME family member 20-like [Octodon degus]|uniref:PRAME family member 20-like n=1 Tax=Octodon degus TaxID=10160 RepID=A0A6P3FIN5_OCTDE|nr:PRAME family member 20-like [Octodon degus]